MSVIVDFMIKINGDKKEIEALRPDTLKLLNVILENKEFKASPLKLQQNTLIMMSLILAEIITNRPDA